MLGDYRKFVIEMKRECSNYRLWKRGTDQAVCVVETYKNKRSIYFAVSNLLPSSALVREEDREYHLLLLGVDDGELIHRDFGPFYVNHQGEGSLFKKFTGVPIECYTHCLFVALNPAEGNTETIYRGDMPFFKPETSDKDEENDDCREERREHDGENFEKNHQEESWREIFERFYRNPEDGFFAEGSDETKATWCRVSQSSPLPDSLAQCRDLITTYGHYMIGKKGNRIFLGIPGRFLKKEQPLRDEGCFTLWQPLRGGERYFKDLDSMTEDLQEEIFGYWICEIDEETGKLLPL